MPKARIPALNATTATNPIHDILPLVASSSGTKTSTRTAASRRNSAIIATVSFFSPGNNRLPAGDFAHSKLLPRSYRRVNRNLIGSADVVVGAVTLRSDRGAFAVTKTAESVRCRTIAATLWLPATAP